MSAEKYTSRDEAAGHHTWAESKKTERSLGAS